MKWTQWLLGAWALVLVGGSVGIGEYKARQRAQRTVDIKVSPVAANKTAEHGRYVAQMCLGCLGCLGCQGATLASGPISGAPPSWPAAAKLNPGEGSAMLRCADTASFAQMIKSGKQPEGSAIAVMPFESLTQMNDVDVGALFVYLKGLK